MIFFTIILLVLNVKLIAVSLAQEANSSGLIQYTIESKITSQEYRLFVVVPENYRELSDENYDVVYVLDVNTEDAAQLLQFQRSITQLPDIPDFILVGVGFASDAEHRGLRTAHFTPSSDAAIDEEILTIYQSQEIVGNAEKWRSGGAEKFKNILSSELIPFLNNNYQTTGKNTAMGASLAGLFLTVVLLVEPQIFENYVITSPSVWWNDFELFNDNSAYPLSRNDLVAKVYLSVGGLENAEMIESHDRVQKFLQQNQSENLDFSSTTIPNQSHLSVIPISYFNGLLYIFSD